MSTSLNGITPWVAGQSSPTWTFLCQRDGKVFDLTGQQASYISIIYYNNVSPSFPGSFTKVKVGGGVVSIVSVNPGIINYAPDSNDTATLQPGQYYVRIEVLFGGLYADYCDYLPLMLQA